MKLMMRVNLFFVYYMYVYEADGQENRASCWGICTKYDDKMIIFRKAM